MKNRRFIRLLLAAVVIAIPVGLVLAGVGATWRSPSASLPAAAVPSSARRLLTPRPTIVKPQPIAPEDKRPLQERAKESGGVKLEKSPKKADEFADLAELNANSSAVIIGTPLDNIMNLTPDGMSVTIDYKVRVEYVYKGGFQEGSFVTVSLPGGMVRFADGSTAEVKTPWFKKMQHGTAYALFLKSGPRSGAFAPTGEAQGVFEIPTTKESRVVKTQSGLRQDRIHKYHDMDVNKFFQELRKITGKKLKK
jgi:hypothetical protein